MSLRRAALASLLFSSVLSAAALVACGGNVVYVEDGDGSGGADSTTTTGSSPTSSVVTTGPGSSSVSSVTSGPSTSVTTGSGGCDTGVLDTIDSFTCQNCVECAQGDPCGGLIDSCFADMQCSSFIECINDCMDDTCFQQCQMQFPEGAQGYFEIINCLVCDACPNNCDAASNCPFMGGP